MQYIQAKYLESSALESKCNQIQEVYELAKHDALRGSVLLAKVVQLLHERLNLRRRTPLSEIDSADDTLARFSILF